MTRSRLSLAIIPELKMQNKTKVLVVSESRENIYAVIQALQDRDELEMITARSQADVISVAEEHDIALAIMEQGPRAEGGKTAAALRGVPRFRHVPIIFLTPGHVSPIWVFQGYDLGAVDFVVTPWEPYVLSSKASAYITISRLKKQLQVAEQSITEIGAELKSVQDRLALKEREMSMVASLDRLTGLPNRLRMGEMLHSEWLRMAREGKPLAMLFIDVDHIRLFVEHYGQGAEDRSLRRIAGALDAALRRPGDLLGRFGAEKFGAILPDTDVAGSTHIAEAVCAAVRALDIEHAASPVSSVMTVSVGVGSVRPGPGCTAADLIQAADKALYKAKLSGRNRVSYSECEPESCISV